MIKVIASVVRQYHPALLCLAIITAATNVACEDLSAALRSAMRNHPAISGQRASVDARTAGVETAGTARYPSLSGQVQQMSGTVTTDPLTLRLRQPIWAFGRIDAGIYRAEIELKAERAGLLRVQRQLIDSTAVAYVMALTAHERLDISQQNVQQLRELHAQIQRRETGQLASRADVVLAGARLSQALSQYQRFENELQQALNELRAYTMQDMLPTAPVETALLVRDALPVLLEWALQESADMQLKIQQLAVAKAQTDEIRKSAMPTAYLQIDRQPGIGVVPAVTRGGLAFEASLEGMGFAAAGRTREAIAREQAADDGIRSSQNDISRTVRANAANRDLAIALLNEQQLTEEQLTQLLASYQRQYAAGTRQWLDVLNIQRELTEQRLVSIQARSDERVFSLRLSALLGRLDQAAGLSRD